jgi:hypothetical protein
MQPGPTPSLADLQRATPWVWFWCERSPTPRAAGLRRRRHPLGCGREAEEDWGKKRWSPARR